MTTRILAVVEGQTEEAFVNELLAPDLRTSHKYLTPILVGKPGHRGGIRRYPAVRRELLRLLRSDPRVFVTTMFDYYALPSDFPGHALAHNAGGPSAKALAIEGAVAADVGSELGATWDPAHFVPYIQMHEFEAALFSDPAGLARGIERPSLVQPLLEIRQAFADPEHVNDGPDTHPSKRIEALFPGYQKPLHGALAALEIGLAKMLSECPHFSSWVGQLRGLP